MSVQNASYAQKTEVSVPVSQGAAGHESASGASSKAYDSANQSVLEKSRSPLIVQAAEGDTEALTFLLRLARPVIYDQVSRMMGDLDEAEDVTQAVLVRLWTHLSGFRGDARLSSWLFRITSNQVTEHRRREKTRIAKSEAWAIQSEQDEPTRICALDFRAFEENVRALARDLPPLQGAIFRLVDLQGLRPCEAARELGRSQTTIRSSLSRARKRLRIRLEMEGGRRASGWMEMAS